jgi:hypothetical protein
MRNVIERRRDRGGVKGEAEGAGLHARPEDIDMCQTVMGLRLCS